MSRDSWQGLLLLAAAGMVAGGVDLLRWPSLTHEGVLDLLAVLLVVSAVLVVTLRRPWTAMVGLGIALVSFAVSALVLFQLRPSIASAIAAIAAAGALSLLQVSEPGRAPRREHP
jgi:hypothetical protein